MNVNNYIDAKCQYNPYFPRRNEILTYREFVGRLSEAASYDARCYAKQKMVNRKPKTAQQIAQKMRDLDKRNALAADHMAAYARKHNIQPDKTFLQKLKLAFSRSNKKNTIYAC